MAFTRADLALLLPGGPGGSIFSYATDDGFATVQNANYFGPAAAQLPVGTRINVVTAKSTAPIHRKVAVSISNPAAGQLTFLVGPAFA